MYGVGPVVGKQNEGWLRAGWDPLLRGWDGFHGRGFSLEILNIEKQTADGWAHPVTLEKGRGARVVMVPCSSRHPGATVP